MTDSALPNSLGQAFTKFSAVQATAIGSGMVGDQLANQIGTPLTDIFTFIIEKISPWVLPITIINDIHVVLHTIILGLCMWAALRIHYGFVKPKET